MSKSKLTIDDLAGDLLKLIEKVEDLEQKIINLNWKVNLKCNDMQKKIDKVVLDYDFKLKQRSK